MASTLVTLLTLALITRISVTSEFLHARLLPKLTYPSAIAYTTSDSACGRRMSLTKESRDWSRREVRPIVEELN